MMSEFFRMEGSKIYGKKGINPIDFKKQHVAVNDVCLFTAGK